METNSITDMKKVYEILLDLREGYAKDLSNMKHPDKDSRLILLSKTVAIDQALRELGYEETDDE